MIVVTVVLKGAQVFHRGAFSGGDVSVSFGDRVFCKDIVFPSSLNVSSFTILPGFVDVHVHLREPGFSYKETIRTGSLAAAHGGYTAVGAMPNLNPVPDSMETLQMELDAIEKDAVIRVLPYGAITKGEQGGELADLDAMAPYVVAFSDDGKGVQDRDMMRRAMLEAKRLGKLIVAHCEDNSLLRGGYIHDGAYARAHGHRGICSESEWRPIQRDLELVRETGCGYHVCHISTKESVALIRKAKAEGLNVTCETAPHYLLLDDSCLGGRPFQNEPAPPGQGGSGSPVGGFGGRNHRHDRHGSRPSQRRGKGRGTGKKRHGHRGTGNGLPAALYVFGKARRHFLCPLDGTAP